MVIKCKYYLLNGNDIPSWCNMLQIVYVVLYIVIKGETGFDVLKFGQNHILWNFIMQSALCASSSGNLLVPRTR